MSTRGSVGGLNYAESRLQHPRLAASSFGAEGTSPAGSAYKFEFHFRAGDGRL
jgi:hypothetical protein